ncbi:bifunctional serine/threonine-protein kinase/formylglycine-generating enzyme family protein [Fontisphaera persica]|uniref:bifunctional serine/threonine-protein kinase/formylglycine-generating enzyme family protein n=1 Tax=Fontisphaera persica TaxID=2974023 RepID=UPI0024C0E308|nr:bifunctional serine/threonine-protein kinase/formylglycine-generating enzyme family protein [Fontisphaera persica]WCJ58390.1 bifunctional serine/threonine-protein kinase/formylglycine-generating enzyme family protein [Fontisphaera persica]
MSAENINPLTDLDLGITVRGLVPGQKVLNRFTLQRVLGRGGMGVVWLAHDESLDFDVALKFLPEVLAKDRAALEELKREARRSLELSHQYIVKFYYFFQDENCAGISMEYVAGDTLANLRLTRPGKIFEVEELQPWVYQLCQALDYAHKEVKIVHRDLKPANLMVDPQGRLKITDFGIARSVADSLTRVTLNKGGVSGTLVYMSPQQAMGEPPSVADDIYAVGATLYELLTSKPPFFTGEILAQVREKAPPTLQQRRKELGIEGKKIPPAWERTLAACLHKDPAQRPASAMEIIERLNLSGRPAGAGLAGRPSAIQVSAPEEPTVVADAPHKTPPKPAQPAPSTPAEPPPKPKRGTGRSARGVMIEVETELSGPPLATPPATARPPTTPPTAKTTDKPPSQPAAPIPHDIPPESPPPRPPTTAAPRPPAPPPPTTKAVEAATSAATPTEKAIPHPERATTHRPAAGPPAVPPPSPPAPPAPPPEPPAQPRPEPPRPSEPWLTSERRQRWLAMVKAAALVALLAGLVFGGFQGWRYYERLRHPAGYVVVEVEPPDARLELRGAKTYAPQAGGREFHQVEPGQYELMASRPGYWPVTNVLSLAAQEGTPYARYQRVTVRLAPQTGTLALKAVPPDAQVTVTPRRAETGQLPAAIKQRAAEFSHKLLVGEYEVSLTRTGYRPWTTNVTLTAQETVWLAPVLERSIGQLQVDSRPSGAQYTLTGPEGQRLSGRCPALLTNLPAGVWRVSLEAAQYGGFVTNVTVPEERLIQVVGELSRLQGELSFSVAVPQARFTLHGPVELSGTITEEFRQKLPVGEYALVLTASGYYMRTQQFAVTAEQPVALGRLELQRITGWLRVQAEPAAAVLTLQPNRPLRSGELVELPTGAYTLQVELPGYDTRLESLTILERQTNQQVVRLARSLGGVVFRVQPLQATNYLRYLTPDLPGGDVAQARYNERVDLPTGEYELEVGLARYQPLRRRFTVTSGVVTNLGILTLEPLRGGLVVEFAPAQARAELTAVDAPLSLRLTNQEAGSLTAPAAGLPVGEYELRVTAPGFSNYVARLHIQPERTTQPPKIILPRLLGGLRVSLTSPATARLQVSGPEAPLAPGERVEQESKAGRAVTFENLPTGFYLVRATAPGHETLERRVSVSSGPVTEVELPALRRSTGALLVEVSPSGGRLRVEQVRSEAGLRNEWGPQETAAAGLLAGLPTGRYRLTATKPRAFTLPGLGTNDWQVTAEVEVAAGQSNQVSLRLPFASLALETQPPGARLWLGTNLVRETGQPPLVLPEVGLAEKLSLLARMPNHRPTPFVLDAQALGLRPQSSLTVTQALQFWPGPQGDERYWTNSLGMKFVNLNRKVFMAVWECRVCDYTNVMRMIRPPLTVPYEELARGTKEGGAEGNIHQAPIVGVSWEDARNFCAQLQRNESGFRISSNHRYRLPTDAEWSLAFGLPEEPGATPMERSGRLGAPWYVWGREFPPRVNCGNFPQFVSFDFFERLAPVGMFPPNERGLFDMGGNAWEWVEDALDNQSSERVLRGGSWKWDVVHGVYSTAWLASFRRSAPPSTKEDDVGFRVVLEITDAVPEPVPRPAPQLETPSKNVPAPVLAMRHALGWRGRGPEELGREREFKPNLAEARRQWESAARAGDADSQFRVWYLIANELLPSSRGGDESVAHNYLVEAARKGHPAARLEHAANLYKEMYSSKGSPAQNQSRDEQKAALRNEIWQHCEDLIRDENGVLAARAAYLLYEVENRLGSQGAVSTRIERFMLAPEILQWLVIAEHFGHWKAGPKINQHERKASEDAAARLKWERAQTNAVEYLRRVRGDK